MSGFMVPPKKDVVPLMPWWKRMLLGPKRDWSRATDALLEELRLAGMKSRALAAAAMSQWEDKAFSDDTNMVEFTGQTAEDIRSEKLAEAATIKDALSGKVARAPVPEDRWLEHVCRQASFLDDGTILVDATTVPLPKRLLRALVLAHRRVVSDELNAVSPFVSHGKNDNVQVSQTGQALHARARGMYRHYHGNDHIATEAKKSEAGRELNVNGKTTVDIYAFHIAEERARWAAKVGRKGVLAWRRKRREDRWKRHQTRFNVGSALKSKYPQDLRLLRTQLRKKASSRHFPSRRRVLGLGP
jgi:hypothetical protein